MTKLNPGIELYRRKMHGVRGYKRGSGNVLSTAQRKAMPKDEFAIPSKAPASGSYPINDPSHARNALSRVSQFGSAAEKAKVRAAVHGKYPSIGMGSDA